MNDFNITLLFWLVGTFLLTFAIPLKYQIDFITFSTLVFFLLFSPVSLLWMLLTAGTIFLISFYFRYRRLKVFWLIIITLSIMFFFYKKIDWIFQFFSLQPPLVMGIAYFLCKQIHVVMEVGKREIVQVSFRQYMHYSFFLPVMFAGPINRYPHFIRQCERRRIEKSNFTSSFERILYGYSKVILGNYLIAVTCKELIRVHLPATEYPIAMFLDSAADWTLLYAQFSGYTDIALGFALLIGIRLEENFNNPLAASNLIDFWQRWHITLSEWCKDYVFGPIQALSRNQLVAVLAAMIVMGFWHEVSFYYTIWGVYQAMGIALCRIYTQLGDPFHLRIFPVSVRNGITRTATFTWLVSGSPIITYLLSFS